MRIWPLLALAVLLLIVAAGHLLIAWRARRFPFRDLAIAVSLAPLAAGLLCAAQFVARDRSDISSLESAVLAAAIVLAALAAIGIAYRGPMFVEADTIKAELLDQLPAMFADLKELKRQVSSLERRRDQ